MTPTEAINAARLARIAARIERANARRYAYGPSPARNMWRRGWCRAKLQLLERIEADFSRTLALTPTRRRP